MRTTAAGAALAIAVACFASSQRAWAQAQFDEDYDAAADEDDRDAPAATPPLVAFGLGAGAMYLPETRLFNQIAGAAGVGAVPAAAYVIEPTLALQLGRAILPLRMRISAASSGRNAVSLDNLGGLVGFGYLMLQRPDVVLYPSLSIGLLRTRLTVGQAGGSDATTTFAALTQAGGPTQLSRTTIVAEAAFDAQYRIGGKSADARGFYLGGRVGLCAGLADTAWTLENASAAVIAPSGPHAPVAGPLAELTVALRL